MESNITVRVHYSKSEPAVNKSVTLNGVAGVEFARTGNSFDEMERAFDFVKIQQFSDEPILDIYIPSVENSSLAPSVMPSCPLVVHFAPHH